jgi:hypothetical protein
LADRQADGALSSSATLKEVDWSQYDFLDLGASKGSSLTACEHYFAAGRGLGIDTDPDKVRTSRESGAHVIHADALTLDAVDVVRFVSAIDFLEHLHDLDAVEQMLEIAARVATDFIYVSHPSFEGEHYLASLDVVQYWHTWSGHRAHVEVSDYCCMLERLRLHNFSIQYLGPVTSTDHSSIIPTGYRNSGQYDRDRHGAKVSRPLEQTVWRSQRIFIALKPFAPSEWKRIVTSWPIRES